MRRALLIVVPAALAIAAPVQAQSALTLADAMARARAQHPGARAAAAAEREATQRVAEARAGYFPRIDFSETWQRGNQPVFAFGTILSQRRFTEANFAIDALNHPEAVDNFRSAFLVEQPLFDGGFTRLAVQGARLGQEAARAARSAAEQDLALAAARAYARVVQAEATERAARSAVEAAEADLRRALDRREAGLVTEADVLAVDVHLAQVRGQAVQAGGELRVARAELNAAIGAPLDEQFTVTLPPHRVPTLSLDALEQQALTTRPELRQAAVSMQLAANARETAGAAYLPQVGLQGAYELNGQDFGSKVSGWFVGAQVRINLFRGLGDRARIAAATEAEVRRSAEREALELAVRIEVRAALARLEAAQAREQVGTSALAQAREGQRIVRDRYDGGLATVTDILRAAQAVLDAESRAIASTTDVTLQALALDRALGRL